MDDMDWNLFLADTITPRFPDGLTVLDAAGQWRGPTGAMEGERSKVVIILSSPGPEKVRLLDEISSEYKRRFAQESVLLVIRDACATFS